MAKQGSSGGQVHLLDQSSGRVVAETMRVDLYRLDECKGCGVSQTLVAETPVGRIQL